LAKPTCKGLYYYTSGAPSSGMFNIFSTWTADYSSSTYSDNKLYLDIIPNRLYWLFELTFVGAIITLLCLNIKATKIKNK
jgi:hypothetical protein